MRRTGSMLVLAALLLSATSGCGTMCNMTGHEACLLDIYPARPIVPFGGVGNDLRWMARGPGAIVPAAIDMPFSLVGDFVTLPWTAYEQAKRRDDARQEHLRRPPPPEEKSTPVGSNGE